MTLLYLFIFRYMAWKVREFPIMKGSISSSDNLSETIIEALHKHLSTKSSCILFWRTCKIRKETKINLQNWSDLGIKVVLLWVKFLLLLFKLPQQFGGFLLSQSSAVEARNTKTSSFFVDTNNLLVCKRCLKYFAKRKYGNYVAKK